MSTTTPTLPDARVGHAGNLTRDPELRYSAKGTPWASVGLAVNRSRRLEDGTFEELAPEFFDVVSFGDLAENVAESLVKGDAVVVAGRLEVDTYIAKDGTQRTANKIVADDVGVSLRRRALEVPRGRRGKAKAKVATVPSADGTWDDEPF